MINVRPNRDRWRIRWQILDEPFTDHASMRPALGEVMESNCDERIADWCIDDQAHQWGYLWGTLLSLEIIPLRLKDSVWL
jgi:hypothetical protein